ncbi:hypothetical protein EDD85DRAFT_795215 [Armillaria nabsnona]|nr:hypothetical protein EDD85DRAFT_795215 [Armillaria nabsnona]
MVTYKMPVTPIMSAIGSIRTMWHIIRDEEESSSARLVAALNFQVSATNGNDIQDSYLDLNRRTAMVVYTSWESPPGQESGQATGISAGLYSIDVTFAEKVTDKLHRKESLGVYSVNCLSVPVGPPLCLRVLVDDYRHRPSIFVFSVTLQGLRLQLTRVELRMINEGHVLDIFPYEDPTGWPKPRQHESRGLRSLDFAFPSSDRRTVHWPIRRADASNLDEANLSFTGSFGFTLHLLFSLHQYLVQEREYGKASDSRGCSYEQAENYGNGIRMCTWSRKDRTVPTLPSSSIS